MNLLKKTIILTTVGVLTWGAVPAKNGHIDVDSAFADGSDDSTGASASFSVRRPGTIAPISYVDPPVMAPVGPDPHSAFSTGTRYNCNGTSRTVYNEGAGWYSISTSGGVDSYTFYSTLNQRCTQVCSYGGNLTYYAPSAAPTCPSPPPPPPPAGEWVDCHGYMVWVNAPVTAWDRLMACGGGQ